MKDNARSLFLAATVVAGVAFSAGAFGAAPALSKDMYKAARQRIEAQHKADDKGCGRLKDDAKDICEVQAKGRALVARADLDARFKPSPEAERDAKEVRAKAEYDLARERCDGLQGRRKDTCLQEAKNVRDASIRQAKIERVESSSELRARLAKLKKGEERKPSTPEAKYASEKAHCEMLGFERDRCRADLKRRFQKS